MRWWGSSASCFYSPFGGRKAPASRAYTPLQSSSHTQPRPPEAIVQQGGYGTCLYMPARGFHLKCTLQAVFRNSPTPCGFGKHFARRQGSLLPVPGSPPFGAVGDPAFVPLAPPCASRLSSGVGAVLTVAMMSALAVSVVAAGTQVSRPRPRPRDGCRAGSVGRDEQRRQGPRVIGVGGGAAQLRCCAAATMRSGGSG